MGVNITKRYSYKSQPNVFKQPEFAFQWYFKLQNTLARDFWNFGFPIFLGSFKSLLYHMGNQKKKTPQLSGKLNYRKAK